ncbi:MAG: HIT family protein [Candidatus Eisenbacteria bacterium]
MSETGHGRGAEPMQDGDGGVGHDPSDCIFCRILVGDAPGTFVYRDEICAALMDIQPVNPGHVLVIPIEHASYLADLDEEIAGRLMRIGHRLSGALRRSGLRCEGTNMFLADGEAAMQDVFHVHLHVFPRFRGDGFGLRLGPEYENKPTREALEDAGQRVRVALGRRG